MTPELTEKCRWPTRDSFLCWIRSRDKTSIGPIDAKQVETHNHKMHAQTVINKAGTPTFTRLHFFTQEGILPVRIWVLVVKCPFPSPFLSHHIHFKPLVTRLAPLIAHPQAWEKTKVWSITANVDAKNDIKKKKKKRKKNGKSDKIADSSWPSSLKRKKTLG
uniref:Uncharacterized protein n=1 Tax=Strigamia maritima TaxID=126957 RepID=T1J1P3_STRMM